MNELPVISVIAFHSPPWLWVDGDGFYDDKTEARKICDTKNGNDDDNKHMIWNT